MGLRALLGDIGALGVLLRGFLLGWSGGLFLNLLGDRGFGGLLFGLFFARGFAFWWRLGESCLLAAIIEASHFDGDGSVSYTHLTLPTIIPECRSRWSPYH